MNKKILSVKAILNEYYNRGLRMIEIYKHEFKDLSIIAQIKIEIINLSYLWMTYHLKNLK